MSFAQVAVIGSALRELFTYSIPDNLKEDCVVGMRVKIPLGRRQVLGVIVELTANLPSGNFATRPIEKLVDQGPVITPRQMELCRFVAEYYFCGLADAIKLCLPPSTTSKAQGRTVVIRGPESRDEPGNDMLGLTAEQVVAAQTIIAAPPKSAFLLQGITGSGKTEVYFAAAKSALSQGQSVLMIVPEIALTPQLQNRAIASLKREVLMFHSGVTKAKRRDQIFSLLNANSAVVIGARSALFAPIPNLGLIVVDEEHDASLKQDETPRYHARDVSIWRAKNENAKIILGSATPSLESQLNAKRGKLVHLSLKERFGEGRLPAVEIIDLRERRAHDANKRNDSASSLGQPLCILSQPLKIAISETLAQKQQVMLLLNRRGYAAFVLCDACGRIVKCPNCSVSMTYYSGQKILCCHQCDFKKPLETVCSECHHGPLLCLGIGTERLEAEIQSQFPDARVGRLDRDAARNFKAVQKLLKDTADGNIDILLGTQMLAKGHDFPNVSLVGVVLADIALAMPDFRATEKAFQLLTQVAGRAGRSNQLGRVMIQAFNPENPAISFAQRHDVEGFSHLELAAREVANQPPFVRAALIRIEGRNSVLEAAQLVAKKLTALIEAESLGRQCSLLGPAPAPIERLRGKTRFQIYLRARDSSIRAKILGVLPELKNKLYGCKLIVDVDPINLL